MPDLIFTIKTPAELEGAQAAAQQLEVAIGKAEALGKEYGALEQRLAAVKASIQNFQPAPLPAAGGGLGALGNEADQAGEKVKLFAGHAGELKKTIRELSHEFPIAGLALRAFANPIGAALTIAIGIVVAFKRHISELNAELDAMEDSAARPFYSIKQALIESQEELRKMRESEQDFFKSQLADDNKISRRTDERIEKLKLQTTASLELLKATEELELAQAGDDEQKKTQIRINFQAAENRIKGRSESEELKIRESGLADLRKQFEEAFGKFGAASSKEQDPARLKDIETLKQQVQNQKSDATPDAIKLTREEIEKMERALSGDFLPSLGLILRALTEGKPVSEVVKDRRDYLEAEKRKLPQQQAESLGEQGDSPAAKKLRDLSRQQEQSEKDVKEAQSHLASLTAQIKAAEESIARIKTEIEIQTPARQKVFELHKQLQNFEGQQKQSEKDSRAGDAEIREFKRHSGSGDSTSLKLPEDGSGAIVSALSDFHDKAAERDQAILSAIKNLSTQASNMAGRIQDNLV